MQKKVEAHPTSFKKQTVYYDGTNTPPAPSGQCITIDQYWSPTGSCIEIWRAWDAYCWTYEYQTQDCADVESEIWMDPSLLDPEVPEDGCWISIRD